MVEVLNSYVAVTVTWTFDPISVHMAFETFVCLEDAKIINILKIVFENHLQWFWARLQLEQKRY